MKKNILLLAFLASLTFSSANDVIIFKNSTRVDAKIVEVSDSELRYFKVSNLNGPTFITKLSDISIVIFDNGDIVSYADYKQTSTPTKPFAKKDKNAVQTDVNDTTSKSNALKFNPEPSDKRTFGLSLGYASKRVVLSDGDKKVGYLGDYEPCFQFGFLAQPEIKYGIGIKTGLNFEIGHETKEKHENQIRLIDLSLSLPVQVSYRYEIIKNLSIFIYTGPVFDFGVYMAIAEGASPYSDSQNFYTKGGLYKESGYTGFNCLWGIGAGIQYCGLRLTIGGDFGMVNLSESSSEPIKLNRPFMISLAYMFNNKK